jgi:hypothetical protein
MSLSASADFNALKFRMHIKAELYRARLHSEKVRTAIAVAFDRHRGNIRLPLQELEYFGDKLLHVTHIAIAAGESIAAKGRPLRVAESHDSSALQEVRRRVFGPVRASDRRQLAEIGALSMLR